MVNVSTTAKISFVCILTTTHELKLSDLFTRDSKSPMVPTWEEVRKGQTMMGKTKVDTSHKIMFISKSYSATISFLFYRPTNQRSLTIWCILHTKIVSFFFNYQTLSAAQFQSRSANAFTGLLGNKKSFLQSAKLLQRALLWKTYLYMLDLAFWRELSGINSALFKSPK